ncbi:HTH domain-containing protein [Corticicoccus populi]|uniref:HTH domain-containing protein n=1 Tax=Corticicoccus populi TaxID=1812821 RepID=A0ABW5WXL6_9STAP
MNLDLSKRLKFLDDKPRQKALFLLLLRSEQYITSRDLAAELKVTSRTIKNDIQNLKNELSQIEISVTSKPALGYKLEVSSTDLENHIKEYFQIYQPTTIDNEFDNRVHYILRRMLSSDVSVKIEFLQNELNVGYALNKEMQRVKELLGDYDLYLVSKPYHGMEIKGSRFKKIMLTIRVYRHFDKHTRNDFMIKRYNSLFLCDTDERTGIRQTFYKEVMQSRIVFSDINAERFIIYLIYFRNQVLNGSGKNIDFELPVLDFDEKMTDEYELVYKIVHQLNENFKGFNFDREIIRFLTLIAVISTDLYRYKDCVEENYDTLVPLSSEIRGFILAELSSYLQIDAFHSAVCHKDLLKIIIPISMKVKLGVSDCVDLGYENVTNKEYPLLRHFMEKIYYKVYRQYGYKFSKREAHIIFGTVLWMLNRIELDHRKLRLAIIAVDGRLSTQQLKFNLNHHFSDYIERIETKVLYELDSEDSVKYDYYLCSNYGKNMNIQHKPIYFAKEGMTELEYVDSLSHIFTDSFDYDKKLPEIHYEEIDSKYRFSEFPAEKILLRGIDYEYIHVPGDMNIHFYINFRSDTEQFKIYSYPANSALNMNIRECYIVINLNIEGDRQKLRMFLNVIDHLLSNKEIINDLCTSEQNSYSMLLSK